MLAAQSAVAVWYVSFEALRPVQQLFVVQVPWEAALFFLEKPYWLQLVDSCIVTEMYALPLGRRGAVLLSAAHGRGLPWTMRVLIYLFERCHLSRATRLRGSELYCFSRGP